MLINGDSSLPIYIRHGQLKTAAQLHQSRRRRHGRLLTRRGAIYTTLAGLPLRLRRLLSVCLLMGCIALLIWSFSERRRDEIAIIRLSCGVPSFWRFLTVPEFLRPLSSYYTSDDWHISRAPASKLGMVQVCDKPYKSQTLGFLLENHRDYAQRHGYEYTLWTGRTPEQKSSEGASWLKIVATKRMIEQELAKPIEQRLQWIFHTDTDTFIASSATPLHAFLPPDEVETPFLILSRDHNAINAGVFLVRVDERSVALFNQILRYPRKNLRWNEQSALIALNDEHRLEENGQMVVMPAQFFNSYSGRNSFPGEDGYSSDEPSFQLHFPNKWFKRLILLPLIRDLQSGAVVKSDTLLAREAALFEQKGHTFWQVWQTNRQL